MGVGLGTFLPTLWIGSEPSQDWGGGFSGFNVVLLVSQGVGLLIILLFLKDKPELPPSVSQRIKLFDKNERNSWEDIKVCLKNKQFLKIFVSFGLSLGLSLFF